MEPQKEGSPAEQGTKLKFSLHNWDDLYQATCVGK
jgi:hypothetical protein